MVRHMYFGVNNAVLSSDMNLLFTMYGGIPPNVTNVSFGHLRYLRVSFMPYKDLTC